jgi:hypothetical protein
MEGVHFCPSFTEKLFDYSEFCALQYHFFGKVLAVFLLRLRSELGAA